jgi:hypothetical protein
MKVDSFGLPAAFAVIALGLVLSGCQQPAASTPPATTTVIEDVHHDDKDDRKMQDRDHPRPDDPARRDHPDDPNRR